MSDPRPSLLEPQAQRELLTAALPAELSFERSLAGQAAAVP